MDNSQLNGRRYPATAGAGPGSDLSREGGEDQYILSFRDLLRILLKRMWLVALVVVLLVGTTLGFRLWQVPVYETSVKILVGQEAAGDITTPKENVAGLQQLTLTMAEGIKSRPIAEAAIQQLGLQMTADEFLEHLSVHQIDKTQFIQVSYRDSSPERARQAVNAIGKVFTEQVSELNPVGIAITATTWEWAETPGEPVSPKPLRDGLVALVVGLILGTGLALLWEYRDDSWRSPEEAEQISGVPAFGVIPKLEAPTRTRKGRR